MSDPIPLDELVLEYLEHHQAYGRSPRTISHYSESFRLLGQFFRDRKLAPDHHNLTTSSMRAFSTWLQETPLQFERRGTAKRSVAGIHGSTSRYARLYQMAGT
ncbi:hypothetical protein BH23CHL4_BH23CHL4_26050 [soil metagenome]